MIMIKDFDNKKIQEFEYKKSINVDGEIIGTCELGTAEFQILNNTNEYNNLKGQWIKTIHGSFYIYNVEPVQEKINIKISCYDIKYKLDTPYDSNLYSWPMNMKEWRNKIGFNCGVVFDDSDFPNSDLILENQPYIGEKPSNRNVIQQIAKAGCSFVDNDENDILYFNWFEDKIYKVDDWIELTTESKKTEPINVVVLGRGDVEDNVYWPEDLPENKVEFRIDNNYILDPQDTETNYDRRYDVIKSIYNRVNGFSYLIFNMRTQKLEKRLSLKLGQKISYSDIWGNTLEAYVMSKTIKYLGGDSTIENNYEVIISASEIKENSSEFSYASNVEKRLLSVSRKTDKNGGKIEDLVKSQDEQSKRMAQLEIDNKSITETVESVQQDIKNLEDTYTFSTDLDISNLIIPSNERLPIETGDFFINYYSYFKGKQVTPIVSIPSKIEGLEITSNDSQLKISVSSETPIANLNNEVEINFLYTEDDYVYSAMKKVMITLAPKGVDGKDGEPGIQGPPGEDGEQTYFYVKYSKNSTGESMTDIPNEETEYMGVSSTTSSIAPTSPSAYTWSKIKGENGKDGENGQNGTPGKNGEDGRTSYLHIKYSDDGVTFTEADDIYGEGERPSSWRGEYVDFTPEDSIEFSDYEWYKLTESIDDTLNDLQNQINDTSTKSDNNYQDLVNQLGDYAKEESITEIRNQVTQYQTSTESNITVLEERIRDGVKEITTETGYTFGKDGLKISKTGAPTGLTIDESGQEVVDKTGASEQTLQYNGYVDDSIATKTPFLDNYKGQTVNYSKNLIFEQYLASQNFRMEEFQDSEQGICLGFFYTGGGK